MGLFELQCHEASIAIYSSMQNKKITHWVFISVTSMVFCLLIYTLTGESNVISFPIYRASYNLILMIFDFQCILTLRD